MNIRVLLLLLLTATLHSCLTRDVEEVNAVQMLYDKNIVIDDSLEYYISNSFFKGAHSNYDYRIVTYVDSSACTPCKMHLASWNQLLEQLHAESDSTIDFLMVLKTCPNDEIRREIDKTDFHNPIYFDENDFFLIRHEFLTIEKFNTVLINRKNKIVAIGNPVTNPKIRVLYKHLLNAYDTQSEFPKFCLMPSISLGAVQVGDTIVTRFKLINKSLTPYSFNNLIPSAQTISYNISTDTLLQGHVSYLTIQYIADSVIGPFNKKIHIIYNEIQERETVTLHGYTIPPQNHY